MRDLIWGFVVVPKGGVITLALGEEDRLIAGGVDTTNLSLFFTDRQTSEESRMVFYNAMRFVFETDDYSDEEDQSAVPARFFHQASPRDLASIRTIKFEADVLLEMWLDGGKQIMSVLRSPWAFICDILAYKCSHLRSLCLCLLRVL